MLTWSENTREMLGSIDHLWKPWHNAISSGLNHGLLSVYLLLRGGLKFSQFQSCNREYYLQFPMINYPHLLLWHGVLIEASGLRRWSPNFQKCHQHLSDKFHDAEITTSIFFPKIKMLKCTSTPLTIVLSSGLPSNIFANSWFTWRQTTLKGQSSSNH